MLPAFVVGGIKMAKKVDITEKLSFEENPRIIIRGQKFEVNADAETMLLIMGDFSNKTEIEATLSAYERMFNEKDRKTIGKMKIPFKDLMVIIKEAMDLVQGNDEGEE